jgi:hypothetical protein
MTTVKYSIFVSKFLKFMIRNILFILLLLFCLQSFSQQVKLEKGYVLPGVVIDGDTLAIVELPKVIIHPPMKFKDREEYLNYRRLVRDIKKVYPYAQIAKKTFIEIQVAFETLPEGNKRKKYVKSKEDELMALYADELKGFSIRQGELLIKLVDREVNQTSYDVIKEFKGGFSATMWQGVARMFGESLKSEYDPTGEDIMIERIVLMIEQGLL